MEWTTYLAPGETLRWEGRPAPRAYVFRNWKHALFGLLLLAVTVYWQVIALPLGDLYQKAWLPWIPLPFLLIALYLGIGHVLLARLEWEKVFYALSDRRLLVQKGVWRRQLVDFPLSELTSFRVLPLGNELASIQANNRDSGRRLLFIGVEQPRQVIVLLEEALAANGYEVSMSPV